MKWVLFSLILFIGMVGAWTQETSIHVAKQVLIEKYPSCALQIEQGVKEVYKEEKNDEYLGEPVNFHCDTMTCLAFNPLYCNTKDKSCPSEIKAGNVKSLAQKECNCEQAKGLAKSITYYIAKYNPMNVMVNESIECRNEFNNQVNMNIKNNEDWKIEVQCEKPNVKFTFDKKKFEEVINNAKGFVYANAFTGTSPWYCYTLEEEGEEEIYGKLKDDGSLCVSDVECKSDYCNNKICCAGGMCCPNPNVKGYPCVQGQMCNENYVCEYLQYSNGEVCEYNEECYSGKCAFNMFGNNAFCAPPGVSYGCVSNDDCYEGYECVEFGCKYVPSEKDKNGNKEENGNGNGICLVLPLIILTGLFVWRKLY